jgi:hypothetical protein
LFCKVNVNIDCFQKISKYKKIKTFKKKIEEQHDCGRNHIPINKCLHNTQKAGALGEKNYYSLMIIKIKSYVFK